MARRRISDDDKQPETKVDDFPYTDAEDEAEEAAPAPKATPAPAEAPQRRRVAKEAPEAQAPDESAPARRLAIVKPLPDDDGPPVLPLPRAVAEPGTQVTVTWGKELFSPKQFHTFEVGPFVAVVTTRPGESIAQASERAMADLAAYAEKERDRKRASYERACENRR